MKKLSDAEIRTELEKLPGWRKQGEAITKTFELPSFARAVEVVNAAAKHADSVDHHPDMLIQYRKLTFTLNTHDVGGVSEKDIELARAVDKLAK